MNDLSKLIMSSNLPAHGGLPSAQGTAFTQPNSTSAFSPPPLLLAALAQQQQQSIAAMSGNAPSSISTPSTPNQNSPSFPIDMARIQQQVQLQQAQQALIQQLLLNQLNNSNGHGGPRSAPATATTFPTPFAQINTNLVQQQQQQQQKPQGFPFASLNPLLASLKPPPMLVPLQSTHTQQMPPPKIIPQRAPNPGLRKHFSTGQIDFQPHQVQLIQQFQTNMKNFIDQQTANNNNNNRNVHTDRPGTSSSLTNPAPTANEQAKVDPRSRSSSGSSGHEETFEMGRLPLGNYYPTHFMKGTIIELADGRTKKVEDMSSDDFLKYAEISSYLTMETSVVERIEQIGQLIRVHFEIGEDKAECAQEYQPEHPFFVVAHGWSSHDPKKTKNTYGLEARQLLVGDICISLTQRPEDVNGGSIEETVSISSARRFADRDAQERALKRRHSLSDQSSTTTDSGHSGDIVSGGSSSSGSSPLLHHKKDEENEQENEERETQEAPLEKKTRHNSGSEEIDVSS